MFEYLERGVRSAEQRQAELLVSSSTRLAGAST